MYRFASRPVRSWFSYLGATGASSGREGDRQFSMHSFHFSVLVFSIPLTVVAVSSWSAPTRAWPVTGRPSRWSAARPSRESTSWSLLSQCPGGARQRVAGPSRGVRHAGQLRGPPGSLRVGLCCRSVLVERANAWLARHGASVTLVSCEALELEGVYEFRPVTASDEDASYMREDCVPAFVRVLR